MTLETEKILLLEKLRVFLEIHGKTKIANADVGVLKMYILHSKNNYNKTPKEKIINFILLRIEELLLAEMELTEKSAIVVDYLIQEASKFYSSKKK